MPLSVSVVIPTWNGRHLLERFLPSVIAAAHWHTNHSSTPVEILVVDDGSADGTAAWLVSLSSRTPVPIRVVRHDVNLGFGAAANRGVAEAAFPLVWLLNNDVEVEREGIARLARAFDDAAPTLFAVHSRMVDVDSAQIVGTGKIGDFARGFLRVHRSYITTSGSPGPFWSMFATGGSTMFRRDLFLELGGFDPIFAPFYFEDVELSYRAWKRGCTVGYEPQSVVRHRFSSTIRPLTGGRVERISQRNRLQFHWIHLHDGALLRSHAFWLAILLLSGPVRPRFLLGFWDALKNLREVRARRRVERARATRTDRDVLRVFADLRASGTIRAYDNPRELPADSEELSVKTTQDVDLSVR